MIDSPPAPPQRLTHRWLLVVPFVWQVGLIPFANRSTTIAHIPFLLMWQMVGICLASVVIGVVYLGDRRAGVDEEEQAFLEATELLAHGSDR